MIIFLLWNFIIGFRLGTKSEIKKLINNSSDINLFVVDHYGELYPIDNMKDSTEVINVLSMTKVRRSTDSWIGGAYKLIFINNKTNDKVEIVVHPKQITVSRKRFSIIENEKNTYRDIDQILKKYIEDVSKFKY